LAVGSETVTWVVVGVNPPQSREEIRAEDLWPACNILPIWD
jgi:hypothetical protein